MISVVMARAERQSSLSYQRADQGVPMSYRDVLKPCLKEEESVRNKMYRCPAGRNTIGCGHDCDANPLPPDMQIFLERNGHITDAMVDTLLERDIDRAETGARKLFSGFDLYTVNRQAGIVDLLFNLGLTRFSRFVRTIDAIRQNDWVTAAAQLRKSKWYTQVGTRGPRVVKLILEG
jgi:lysozyme